MAKDSDDMEDVVRLAIDGTSDPDYTRLFESRLRRQGMQRLLLQTAYIPKSLQRIILGIILGISADGIMDKAEHQTGESGSS